VAAALTLGACGSGSKDAGSVPSVPVVPTPTPVPTAAAETPLATSCLRLSSGSTTYRCDARGASFQHELEEAIDLLKSQRPQIFDGDTVLNVGAFVVGIIRNLDAMGVCSTYDGEELVVRTEGDFSDQYDILTSNNLVRRYYAGTCSPAVFPLAQAAAPSSPAGCPLAPSHEVACGTPPTQYLDDVMDAIDELLKAKPEIFDTNDRTPAQGWPAVKDWPAYYQGVVDILSKKGYCGRFDGEELAVKKTNEFSESFDINYQDKYIRLGPGIYRSACYPAQF